MFQSNLNLTYENVQSEDPNIVRALWSRIADLNARDEDPFEQMEGGPNQIIETIGDTSKGRGSKITFPMDQDLHNEPKLGSERFASATDYDTLHVFDNQLTVDFFRFGLDYDVRAEEMLGMRGEIYDRVPDKQGIQVGRYRSEITQMTILHKTNAENRVIAGNRTTSDDLRSSDGLTYDEIVALNGLLEPMGGQPAVVGKDSQGNMIRGRVVVATSPAAQFLKTDPAWMGVLERADNRGEENHLFAGGLTKVDGTVLKKYVPIDRNEPGAIGCPLTPKARLGVAIAAGAGALDITGGSKSDWAAITQALYFKHFPKYAYRLLLGDTLSTSAAFWGLGLGGAAAGNFFVTVVNSRSSSTAPGKWCIYEISANNGNKLTVAKRLGNGDNHSGGNIQWNQVGNVTWDANKHTQDHDSGALVYLSTSYGLPLMATPVLSRKCMRRGYGKYTNHRAVQEDEGGFGKYLYVWNVTGTGVVKDALGRVPGIAILIHTGNYEGWNIPTRS